MYNNGGGMKSYLILFILLCAAGCTNKEPFVNGDEKKLCDRITKMDSEFDSVFVKIKEIEINPGDDNVFGFIKKAIIKKNNIYISTSQPAAILVLALDGKLIRKIGGPGSGPGEYKAIRDFDVDGNGNIYLLDTPNSRVSVFSDKNVFLNSFSVKINSHICSDNKGGYFLYNSGADPKSGVNVVTHFDKKGEQIKDFCRAFNSIPMIGGAIICAFDNNIYLNNASTYLVKKYNMDGRLLSEYKDVPAIFKESEVKGIVMEQDKLQALPVLTGISVTCKNLVILEYQRHTPQGKWNDIYYTDGTLLKRGLKVNYNLGLRVISDDENICYIQAPETGSDYNENTNYKIVCYQVRGSK